MNDYQYDFFYLLIIPILLNTIIIFILIKILTKSVLFFNIGNFILPLYIKDSTFLFYITYFIALLCCCFLIIMNSLFLIILIEAI